MISENKPEKHICAALLAHVDAGKTTLSEALMYEAGAIRKPGRVDHGDAFLDTDAREKARGITIFSKQAEFTYGNTAVTLLDTPGHVDFCAEMERTLQVLDYAVLVISGKDGIQGHTATLWRLLDKYGIPAFIFVNKMDLDGADKKTIMDELHRSLAAGCSDFTAERNAVWLEELAMCSEELMNEFLDTESISTESMARAVQSREIFPCYFGSALKLDGITELLDGMAEFTLQPSLNQEFGARVYKITRDDQGNRLTHLRLTGGSLHTKELVGEEKVEQIRIYSGARFTAVESVRGGDICAVTGLRNTYAGQGLGAEKQMFEPLLESVLLYQVILPPQIDVHTALTQLRQLEEEDPQLHVIWNEQLQEIQMQLMGEVQIDILKDIINERFGYDIEFGQGSITYKETIEAPVTGAGHFEPLRHYAEVQLLLEPGERGSGLVFDSVCSEDVLDRNWQRLIMTHLMEKEHIGVLTGSPVTDMKITILTGRAHLKHTEGGDFRQATYRAVRQGLRKARSVLLEPWYEFRLEVPSESVGRAMSDIQKMGGSFAEPQPSGGSTILTGKAPVSEMKDYFIEVTSYTKGHGHLACSLCGYEPCHNSERIISEIGYDPDRDIENPADSVFCSHGAGHNIRWDEVDEHLHTSAELPGEDSRTDDITVRSSGYTYKGTREEDAELDRIFERTYGKPKQRHFIGKREITAEQPKVRIEPAKVLEEYLLVDGYNIIFAWDQLKELAKVNMDSAREALIQILSNYQGYRSCHVIVVFDAYKVKGGERRFEKHENVDVVYTKEAETADMYIEKTAHRKSGEYMVRVATSDRLEQLIIMGGGAFKVSAEEFRLEIEQAEMEISALIEEMARKNRLENKNGIVFNDK
ncbi:MAG: TetM/TetW/TetO/TetS family tetracycline resistance ribosomal protection protein [Bacillota bacterium]|nr:TetM/TetW/TetO/TetS family tetracycline resistance ribosomal protection protein [Bacillota bacterium]